MGSWKSQYAFPFNCEMAGTALWERSWVELLCLFRRVLPSVTGIFDASETEGQRRSESVSGNSCTVNPEF